MYPGCDAGRGSAPLVTDAVSPLAGVAQDEVGVAQVGLVSGVVPDVPTATPVPIGAGVGALAGVDAN
jgi:hypothetical protein